MTRLPILLAAAFVFTLSGVPSANAQYQKPPYQKGPGAPESDDEPEGGYQQPPPTGAMQGPESTIGLGGGEIEIPAIKLKLPRIRFPSLSSFRSPPKMILDEAVAPFVKQFREEFSIESGGPEGAPEPTPESDDEPEQKPAQKSEHLQPYQDAPSSDDGSLAWQLNEFRQRERILSERLDMLQGSVERLITGLESQPPRQQTSRRLPNELRQLPDVTPFPVRRTSYIQTISTQRTPRPRLERLPPVR